MATKKRNTKKAIAAKKTAGGKVTAAKKRVKKSKTSKKAAKKVAAPKAVVKKQVSKKAAAGKTVKATKKTPRKIQSLGSDAFSRERATESAGQSGDLQGLSNVESADSESVDELIEEGNAFEAGVVSGVEDSEDHEGREVRTREVLEDDVPDEYLDQD
jgi:hypothetical protein